MKHNTLVEPLETRIALATLVNPTTVTFTDEDGDTVVVKTTRGTFDLGDFTFRDFGDGREQLQFLELDQPEFSGASIRITVTKRGADGDGLVNVGHLAADGIDLGSVIIKGDLARITAGDETAGGPAVKLLKVRSIGLYGLATQDAGANLNTFLEGDLGKLIVQKDMRNINFGVFGDIGSITIGGSFIGTDLLQGVAGSIDCSGNIGAIRIGRDIVGGILGNSGNIECGGAIASITIGGSLIGGFGTVSGFIRATLDIGPVKIGQDIIGGGGTSSGAILSNRDIASVTIGGSILGGLGTASGSIIADRELGSVKVGLNVTGAGSASGRISGSAKVGAVTIGGSLIGSDEGSTGNILSGGDIGMIKIGGNIKGGAGNESGKIASGGSIAGIRIGGSVLGGDGDYDTEPSRPGQIFASGTIGAVSIGGNLRGGDGLFSGAIANLGGIGNVTVGGSVIGGDGGNSGAIFSSGGLGLVTIKHDLHGGAGNNSGIVVSAGESRGIAIGGSLFGGAGSNSGVAGGNEGSVDFVRVGGDVVGGSGTFSGIVRDTPNITIGGSLIGGTGNFAGSIISNGRVDSISIGHDLIGGSISGTSETLDGSGFIEVGDGIGRIVIGGSVITGTDGSTMGSLVRNASIRTNGGIDSLTVKGSLIGNKGSEGDTFVIIAADREELTSETSHVVIGRINIGGRVEFAQILAGYDISLDPESPDAQIGSIKVGGDWIASSIIAGAVNLGADDAPGGSGADADNVNFGDAHDAKIPVGDSATIVSRIGSIHITGEVFGTPSTISDEDSFGFVAEEIGDLKVGARSFALVEGSGNDAIKLGLDLPNRPADFVVHEIGADLAFAPPSLVSSAKLINASAIVYTDSDGDRVTVKLSKPLLNENNVNDVFFFDTGNVGEGDSLPQQLQFINLTALATNGLGVTVSVKRGGGDGLAQIGRVHSSDFSMGHVRIEGDLGSIDGGGGAPDKLGLLSLSARSYGRYGIDTQSANFSPSVGGEIGNGIGAIKIQRDIVGASIDLVGDVKSITIGGSLIGGEGVHASGSIGVVKIGEHLQGGQTASSGSIGSDAGIKSVSIGGSLIGGEGVFSGAIVNVSEGSVRIAHNLIGGGGESSGRVVGAARGIAIQGSMVSGIGGESAVIASEDAVGRITIGHNVIGRSVGSGFVTAASIDSISIGGSLVGGGETASGFIQTTDGDIGSLKIAHDLGGGTGDESGKIRCIGSVGSITIGGSLIGGSGHYDTIPDTGGFQQSGQIYISNGVNSINIGKDVSGGDGRASGSVVAIEEMKRVAVGGSVTGGSGDVSGCILASTLGAVKVAFDLAGGSGEASCSISASVLGSAVIGGSVLGGSHTNTGTVTALEIDSIKVGGDVIGGSDDFSGVLGALGGSLGNVVIGGSLVGGTASTTGVVFASLGIANAKIGHHLIGTTILNGDETVTTTGTIVTSRSITSLSIGGSLIAGWDGSLVGDLESNASIMTGGNLQKVSIAGSLLGNLSPFGSGTPRITAQGTDLSPGESSDFALRSLKIGGDVDRAQILAGYTTGLQPVNGKASIGSVTVNGDWIGSDLVAGVQTAADPNTPTNSFGDDDDERIDPADSGRINSVAIKGLVVGTANDGDHFGFVAGQIGAFKSLSFAGKGASLELLELSTVTGDVTVRAV